LISVKEAHRRSSRRHEGKQTSMSLKFKEVEVIDKYATMTHDNKKCEDLLRKKGERLIRAPEQFNSNELEWNYSTQTWCFKEDLEALHYHPLLEREVLMNYLEDIARKVPQFDRSVMEFHVMEKITIIEDVESKDWTLYCTQSYNRNYHGEGSGIIDECGVYNAVSCELKDEEGNREVRDCLVLAIIYLEIHIEDDEKSNITSTFLCVSPLQESEKVGGLPYDYQRLCSSRIRGNLDTEIIVAKNKLISPVFIVPYLDEHTLDYDVHLHDIDLSSLTYITIPLERMSFPAVHLSSIHQLRELSPTIFVSESFLKKEQTRLLLDNDDMAPSHDLICEEVVDDVDMDDGDSEEEDFKI
jgi:hypothetical protein